MRRPDLAGVESQDDRKRLTNDRALVDRRELAA